MMNHLTDEQLQSFLENINEVDSNEIQEHLDDCEVCKLNLSAYQNIYGILESESIPDLSPDFVQMTVGKLKNSNEKKWMLLENITISIMFVISLLISIYFLDYLNVLTFFKEIDFSLFTGIGKRVINVLSPNVIYIIAALLITISVELIDRFKIQKLVR
jgi:hypothetical protein